MQKIFFKILKPVVATIILSFVFSTARANVIIEDMHRFFTSATLINEGIDIRINGVKPDSRKAALRLAQDLRACAYDVNTDEESETHVLSGALCPLQHTAVITQRPAPAEEIAFDLNRLTTKISPDITAENVLASWEENQSYLVSPRQDGSGAVDKIEIETVGKGNTLAWGDVNFSAKYREDNRTPGAEKVKYTVIVSGGTFSTKAEYRSFGRRETCTIGGRAVTCVELAYALGIGEEN